MKKLYYLWLAFAAILILTTPLFAQTLPTYTAPELAVTIDGNLSEWGQVPATSCDSAYYFNGVEEGPFLSTSPQPEDASVSFRVAWSGGKLYLAIEVTDDIRDVSSDKWWWQDRIEILFDGPNQGGTVFGNAGGPQAQTGGPSIFNVRPDGFIGLTHIDVSPSGYNLATAAVVDNNPNWVAEVELRNIPQVALGDTIGLDIIYWDAENGDIHNNDVGVVSWSSLEAGATEAYKNADRWGEVVFSGPVGVKNTNSTEIPDSYTLSQNYPNPFNPTTKIDFQISQAAKVKLEIYDLLGHHIRTLLDGTKNPGSYTISWDGRDDEGQRVASGIYLYKLDGRNFTSTRKMILLR